MGETMNRASRLESTGVPSTVHVDSATLAAAQLTPSSPGVQEREVELKGLGAEKTYLVDPRALARLSYSRPPSPTAAAIVSDAPPASPKSKDL